MDTIKIWADFACPFCYMGEHLLVDTINELGLAEKAQIEFHAYQLDPNAPQRSQESMLEHFMKEHKETEEEASAQMAHLAKMASRLRLEMNIADCVVSNTLDAHRLMKYAQATGTQLQAVELDFTLFDYYFVKSRDLADREVLCDAAASVGFDRREVMVMLTSDSYTAEVKADEEEAEAMKVDYVPYMLMPDGTVLQGVISKGALKKALEESFK